jgi:cell wall-associated NlpC family hydrolase
VEPTRLLASRTIAASLALAGAVGLAVIPSAGPASAEPTLAQTERTLSDLGTKLNAINEQYNDANASLQESREKQKKLLDQIKPFQDKYDEYQERVSAIGAASYRGGQPGMLTAVLTGNSPQDVVDRLGLLDQVSRDQAGAIDALEKARKPLDATKKKLDAEIAVQARQHKVLKDRKALLDRDYAKWKKLNSQLEAKNKSARASRSGRTDPPPVYDGPATGRGATVVKFAYAQIGKYYVFGASGPSNFDCSGLTLRAWSKVGVSMPHSARKQYAKFPKVSSANRRPGDLVFFYSDLHHVGIYVGNGKMIHASKPGSPIALVSIETPYYRRNYQGAVRPG